MRKTFSIKQILTKMVMLNPKKGVIYTVLRYFFNMSFLH
jgi:hypothetical protein